MRIALYGNGSSGNHGCEAIVRGTIALLDTADVLVLSEDEMADNNYGLSKIAKIRRAKNSVKKNYAFFKAYFALKIQKDFSLMDLLPYIESAHECKGKVDFAFAVGGDNYCYGYEKIYALLNRLFQKNAIKTVLWGCSIEPEIVARIQNDLREYDLIVARESITYDAVKATGANVCFSPDPAFFMKPQIVELPECFAKGEVIGINISPVILECENESGIGIQNYIELIRHILNTTDASVAIISHVVLASNDDREPSELLYREFSNTGRVEIVRDHNAAELKYIISKCSFFVGARTHATIAAYSTSVPTLVVGYSVKARGIAEDLFGTTEDYVLPVQSLSASDELKCSFIRLYAQRNTISTHLKQFLPDYLKRADAVLEQLKEMEK